MKDIRERLEAILNMSNTVMIWDTDEILIVFSRLSIHHAYRLIDQYPLPSTQQELEKLAESIRLAVLFS